MDFVVVRLFTQQVFQLQYLFFCEILLIIKDLLFRIKSLHGVGYKSVAYKKKNVKLFCSL